MFHTDLWDVVRHLGAGKVGLEKYAESILGYIRYGIIWSESELYFPVRIKPAGKYDVAKMAREGVSHIELRMIDLNPYERGGMDVRDAEAAALSGPAAERTLDAEKVQAVLAYQRRKFEVPEARYAFRVRKEYGEGFVEKGLKLAKEYSKI